MSVVNVGNFIELILIGFNFFDSSIVWVDIILLKPGQADVIMLTIVNIYLYNITFCMFLTAMK